MDYVHGDILDVHIVVKYGIRNVTRTQYQQAMWLILLQQDYLQAWNPTIYSQAYSNNPSNLYFPVHHHPYNHTQ